MLKNKFRNFIKRLYFKLNPSHKYVLHIDDVVIDLQNRLTALEHRPAVISASSTQVDDIALDKLFLASDDVAYRYLYLLRYMKENCTILDVEGEYGTGVDLLYRYTPVDNCVCLNSISWYTRMGNIYYGNESVRFQTGTVYDVQEKYDVATLLHERRTALFGKEEFQRLYEILEYGGILALALDEPTAAQTALEMLISTGFQVEAHLYQAKNTPEFLAVPPESAVQVIYLRKYG